MTVLTEALTLRKSNTGDFDRLYFLFTKEWGKVSVLVKSGCKLSSKLAPHLEHLSLTQVMLAEGKAGYRLAGTKTISANKKIKNDLLKIGWSTLFLETIDCFLPPQEADPEIFGLAENFLDSLAELEDKQAEQILFNQYFFKLLDHFGYKPELKAISQLQLTRAMIRIVETATDKKLHSAELLSKLLN
jgi:DNA repair protein RecO (recombination protein O)